MVILLIVSLNKILIFNVVPTNNAFKANFAENVIETSISSGSYTPTITSQEATDIEVRNSSWGLGSFR